MRACPSLGALPNPSRGDEASANPLARAAENVLDRQFEAQQPNQKWVADVTYMATASGWLSPFRGARPVFSTGCWLGYGSYL
jgi:transposase InsO family protein